MLYKPAPRSAISAISSLLDSWNLEADAFRAAAVAARKGRSPGSGIVAAARNAQDGLSTLLEEIDTALVALPAGHPDFRDLLHAQVAALALHESISTSLDVLERFTTAPSLEPLHIVHPRPALQFGQ